MARPFIDALLKRMTEVEKKSTSELTREEADELYLKTFSSVQATMHLLLEMVKDVSPEVSKQMFLLTLSINNMFKLYFKDRDAQNRADEASEIILTILKEVGNPPGTDTSVMSDEAIN